MKPCILAPWRATLGSLPAMAALALLLAPGPAVAEDLHLDRDSFATRCPACHVASRSEPQPATRLVAFRARRDLAREAPPIALHAVALFSGTESSTRLAPPPAP